MDQKVKSQIKKAIFLMILGLGFLFFSFNYSYSVEKGEKLTISQILQIKYLSHPIWSPDGGKIAFLWDDGGVKDIWVVSLSDGKPSKISHSRGEIGRPAWNPKGGELLYVQDVQEGLLYIWKVSQEKPSLVEGTPKGISPDFVISPNRNSLIFSKDGNLWLFHLNEKKTFQLTSGAREDRSPRYSPDGNNVAFISSAPREAVSEVPRELTGPKLAFLYFKRPSTDVWIISTSGGKPIWVAQSKENEFYAEWSPDGRMLAVERRTIDCKRQEIWIRDLAGSSEKMVYQESTDKWNLETGRWLYSWYRGLFWSPDNNAIAFLSDRDGWVHLYAITLDGKKLSQLTRAIPSSISKEALTPPEFLYYESVDGLKIPAFLFKPKDFNDKKKYPAIIWIHGDGILQNRYGWHPSKNYSVYYAFHQYLLHKGYMVLAVDYRGSIRYGREFMYGHYMDLGGRDCDDVIKGAEYLSSLAFIDPARIGVWGLSYGGYLILQAIIRKPDIFRASVDVAGVTDWADWAKDPDGWWIRGRMGLPEENPELFYKNAPIHFVENIKTPLLVLHGTADFNVPFYESVRLIDALIKHGKNLELMIYPGEDHYFIWKHTWEDALFRVERFFDRYLKE